MAMLNESDWDFLRADVFPCDDHGHCEMCGACETEVELLQEKYVPLSAFAPACEPLKECLPCRAKAINEDCKREIES